MQQLIGTLRSVSRVLAAASCLLLAAPAAQQASRSNGTTTNIPGALPGIHIVSPVANGQWTMPAGDYGNTRYSPLDKINSTNVQNLHVVATMATGIPHGHEGGAAGGGQHALYGYAVSGQADRV